MPKPILNNNVVVVEKVMDLDDKTKYGGALAGWIIALIILIIIAFGMWYVICRHGCLAKDNSNNNSKLAACLND